MATYNTTWAFTNATTSTSSNIICWVYDNNITSSTTTNLTWAYCNTGNNIMVNNTARVESDEERIARQVRLQQDREIVAAAKVKAEKLLLDHLDEEQAQSWREHKRVHVRSQHGRRYCIEGIRKTHNIFQLDEQGERVKELCVYPAGDIPIEDCVLAQMLSLRYAEDHLLEKANVWDISTGRQFVGRAA